MNIISTLLHANYSNIILAAKALFPNTKIWHPEKLPINDVVDIYKPDILLFDIKYVDKNLINFSKQNSKTKLVLFGNGIPEDLKIDVICALPQTSSVIKKHIESGDHKTLYLHDSANVVSIWGGLRKDYLSCDIGYYSFINDPRLSKEKIRVLHRLSDIGQLKIFGPNKLPLPTYIGSIPVEEISSLYHSANISVDFNGEQLLDIAANGGFAISNLSNQLFPPISEVEEFIKNEKKRTSIIKRAKSNVLNNDTCYHRLYEITTALNIEQANVVWDKINQIKGEGAV